MTYTYNELKQKLGLEYPPKATLQELHSKLLIEYQQKQKLKRLLECELENMFLELNKIEYLIETKTVRT